MALGDDILHLRDTIRTDLDAVHDYFAHSWAAWQIVGARAAQDAQLRVYNKVTGNTASGADLVGLIPRYVNDYLAVATFQQTISLFEDFFFGLIRLWLLKYPHRIFRNTLPVSVLYDVSTLDAVRLLAINQEINKQSYAKVREWFAYLDSVVKLDCPTSEEIDRLAEIKASRDILVHNHGVVTAVYEEKAGRLKRAVAGERLDLPRQYHRQSWELVRKVVGDLGTAAAAKA
jgi:hypothetical protein